MKIQKLATSADLSLSSLDHAFELLAVVNSLDMRKNPSRLQVNQESIVTALEVIRESRLPIALEITPLGSRYGWALWLFDDCVWSNGA